MNQKHRKGRFSKLHVWLVIVIVLVYTAIDLYIFITHGSEPYTLTGCFFAFCATQLWNLANIKKTRIKQNGDGGGTTPPNPPTPPNSGPGSI